MEKEKTEEELVRDYVLLRPLNRPKTNIFHLLALLLTCSVVCFLLSKYVIYFTGTKKQLFVFFLIYFIGFLCVGRIMLIVLVKCYQRYAPEKIRRKCRCMPTCSEYAIVVLKKHCLFVAIYKIFNRVFYTCKGKYKIDEP